MTVAKERVGECFAEVLDKIAERLMEAQPPKTNGEIELRILIHQSQAGAVIGKGGTKIKELREQTGAHLKVFKVDLPTEFYDYSCVVLVGNVPKREFNEPSLMSLLSYYQTAS